MDIRGYLQTSLIEWPGKISSVVFTSGCNFRCPFCHNAGLVDPQKIKKQPLLEKEKILADLKSRKKWLDGVVLTGGEPTLQKDLVDFLKKLKKLNFKIMLETNGSRPEALKRLIKNKLVDFIAMDYKTRLDRYENLVNWKDKYSDPGSKEFYDPGSLGDLAEKVRQSIKLILKSKIPFEFRTTLVPSVHDGKILLQMAKELKKLIAGHRLPITISWILQSFQPKNCLDPKFEKIKPFNQDKTKKFLKSIQKILPSAKLR